MPTMGALHAGHAALIDAARRECGVVVVSIFVNPLQFNNQDDLARYPRTLDADVAFCRELGVDVVFAPSAAEVYPQPLECTRRRRPACRSSVREVPARAFPRRGDGRVEAVSDRAAAPRVLRREGCAAARDRQAARRGLQRAGRRRRSAHRARSRRPRDELAQPPLERRRASSGGLPVSGAARSAATGFRAAEKRPAAVVRAAAATIPRSDGVEARVSARSSTRTPCSQSMRSTAPCASRARCGSVRRRLIDNVLVVDEHSNSCDQHEAAALASLINDGVHRRGIFQDRRSHERRRDRCADGGRRRISGTGRLAAPKRRSRKGGNRNLVPVAFICNRAATARISGCCPSPLRDSGKAPAGA